MNPLFPSFPSLCLQLKSSSIFSFSTLPTGKIVFLTFFVYSSDEILSFSFITLLCIGNKTFESICKSYDGWIIHEIKERYCSYPLPPFHKKIRTDGVKYREVQVLPVKALQQHTDSHLLIESSLFFFSFFSGREGSEEKSFSLRCPSRE